MESFYDILNVPKDASKEDIRKAYLTRVNYNHPDKFSDPNLKKTKEEITMELREAYEVLSDNERRARYDRYLLERESKMNNSNDMTDEQDYQKENENLKKSPVPSNLGLVRKLTIGLVSIILAVFISIFIIKNFFAIIGIILIVSLIIGIFS